MLQVAEEALVRDVLYACQGVNGQFVQYDQDAQQGLGGYVLNAKAGISAAHRPVMLAICELGWLFRCAGSMVKALPVPVPVTWPRSSATPFSAQQ